MKYRVAVASVILASTGCSTTTSDLSTKQQAFANSAPEGKKGNDTMANEAWQAALSLCDESMLTLRSEYTGSGKKELTLASIGIVAGSIVVPALAAKTHAAKSAVAGWGGVSGATNAAQYTLQQKGGSAERLSKVYEATRQRIETLTKEYVDATSKADRLDAITKLGVACRFPVLPGADPPTPPVPPAPAPAPKTP